MRETARGQIAWSTVSVLASTPVIRAFLTQLLLILAIPFLLGSLLQACGGGGGGPAPSNVSSVTIDPVNPSVANGTQIQLHATAILKNKKTKDITASATWGSAKSTIAHVSNAAGTKGVSTGVAVGATTVTAQFQGKTGTSPFTVTSATLKSITVVPVNPVIAKGTTVQLAAQGTFSDGSVQDLTNQVTWSSGNTGIATVSTAPGTLGLVTGVSVGNTPITATLGAIAGSTKVTVSAATVSSITITVPVATIAKGTTHQLTATCNRSDGTTQDCTNDVSWASSNSGIAEVSNSPPTKGLVTGVNVGTSTITASFSGVQGSATVTVTPATLVAITVLPDPSIANGTTVQLTATGEFSDETTQDLTRQVSWTSANGAIAHVGNAAGFQGLVTGLSVGSTPITATDPQTGIAGSSTVTVTPATLISITVTFPVDSIANGTTAQLTATCHFSDGTTQECTNDVSWSSANNGVAVVSSTPPTKGLVKGVAPGSTPIFATFKGVQGSATVTVTPATLTSIVVTPPTSILPKGTTQQLTATCSFSDLSTQNCTNEVGWTPNNGAIAHVSPQGLVTAIAVGSTTITATFNSIPSISGSATVTVTAAVLKSIAVVPANPEIPTGLTEPLHAVGVYSDNSAQDLTTQVSWTPDDSTIAMVSNATGSQGLVTGQKVGSTDIEATFGSGSTAVSGSTTVKVTAATLTSIVVTPQDPSLAPNPSIPKGTELQLIATCNFSDHTTLPCTNDPDLGWSSGNPVVAQVSTLPKTPGIVSGLAVGGASITAALGPVSGSTTVSVTPATLTSITVTPANSSIAKGTTVQLRAIGEYSDQTFQDLTSQVSWTALGGSPAFASVDPLGLVTGLNPGTATITATLGISGSTMVTVTPAVLTSIAITPANFSIPNGTTQILTATGTFSDQSTQDLTSTVSWVVSGGLGTVDSKGLLTATAAGTGTITATQAGITGTTGLTVTPVTLTSIEVTPATSSTAQGAAVQLSATCNYNAGPAHDCTTQVSWQSSNTATATVDSSGSITPGLVHGVAAGGVTITATLPGTPVSGMGTVTVSGATVTVLFIEVTPADETFPKNTNNIRYTALAHFSDGTTQNVTAIAHWSSIDISGTDVADVKTDMGNSSGEVSAKNPGKATITATVPSLGNASGSTTITVI